jgi:ribonuclease P protein component
MTVFILANELGRHRLGITASRKMARHAVARNRAKRLIREAFRLSAADLEMLGARFDWVFNARRGLLDVKADAVVAELRVLVDRLRLLEQDSTKKAQH